MKYKSIMLELLQQRPEMHEQLRQERKLLTALEIYAKELKESHEAITEQLRQARPESDPRQISSEAFEMALKEMEDRLPPASVTDGHEELTLDQAMAHVRSPLPRG
jgi:chromosome segregation ATPase